MPRKLPWATTTTTTSPTATAPPKTEPPPKRQRTSPSSSSSSAGRPARRDVPAPAKTSASNNDPVLAKPEYMTPRDEHYIMVEDEFLTIAQIYTRSVHRAEYERLQHLAHAKNATRISEIQRPVSGVPRMSKETLMKHELAAKQRARESALEGLPSVARKWDEDSSEDEARKAVRSVWAKSSLGLLMCSPKKRERDLSARWTVKPGTRAAAGFVKSEVDTRRRRRRLFTSTDSQEARREINIAERQTESSTGTGKPAVKQAPRPAPPKHEPVIKQGAEPASDTSSSDDDDLDAPVVRQASRSSSQVLPTARPSSIANPPHRSTTFPHIYPPSSTHQPLPKLSRHATAPLPSRSSRPAFSSSPPLPPPKKPPPDFDFDFGLIASKRSASSYRGRSMTARKQAEQQKSILSSPPAKEVGRGGGEVRQRPRLLDALFSVGE